jgi:hypothetical protein
MKFPAKRPSTTPIEPMINTLLIYITLRVAIIVKHMRVTVKEEWGF